MSWHGRNPNETASDDTVMTVQEVAYRFFPSEEDDQQRAAFVRGD